VLKPLRAFRAEVQPPKPVWGQGPWSRFRGLGRFGIEMPINVFPDEVLTPGSGQIKALVCVGGNPAVAFPDQRRVIEALRALELLVVLDVTMTATARLAHWVVGCKLSLETPGTSRTAEGQLDVPFAQYTPAILMPDFDVIEEWEFFWGSRTASGHRSCWSRGRWTSTGSRQRTSTSTSRIRVRACRSARCGSIPVAVCSSRPSRCESSRQDPSAPRAAWTSRRLR
jgi:anaerobic selenocysteine-containing dehydrogenase